MPRRAISLFSGAGGLDLGCEAAGFATIATVESDRFANASLEANRAAFFPELDPELMLGDITEIDFLELGHRAGVEVGDLDLLHGGPPCTPFSKSGYWLEYKRKGADPNASLLDYFVEAARELQPRAILMENVYGLAYNNHNRPVLERFLASMRDTGYLVDYEILLAADFGVPQLRQRMLCVGLRSDLADDAHLGKAWRFDWPDPTHSGPHETRSRTNSASRRHVSAAAALKGLDERSNPPEDEERVEGTYADELREIPPGDNYLFLTEKRGHPEPRFEWRSRYWSFLLKLHPDRPSPTIQSQPGPWVGPFHWDDRRLRIEEIKRLQAFPDEFVVVGSRREQQRQVGNAVPPLLAQRVSERIRARLASAAQSALAA